MENEKHAFEINTQSLDEIRRLIGEELFSGTAEASSEAVMAEETTAQQEEPAASPEPVAVPLEVPRDSTAEDTAQRQEEPEKKKANKRERVSQSREPKGLAYEVYSVLHDVVYVLAALTVIFVFVVRLVGVDGSSMLPTLHNRDYLLLQSNFLYDEKDVKNGDIVVLNVPYYEDKGPIVKRVIATEGQTVEVDYEHNQVLVDGVRLQEDYIMPEIMHEIWDPEYATTYPATVPEGCIFVLGDNRNNSSDSRFSMVGMIDKRYILGKVQVILLPGQTKDILGNITDPRDWSRIGKVS